MATGEVRIVCWLDEAEPSRHIAAVDAIFFAASATQSFAGPADRTAFRERWLGRYLTHPADRERSLLALAGDGAVLGYLVGASDDPARAMRFADIAYFAVLADLTAQYTAHLHINLAAAARNRGIGGRLIAAFCAGLAADGVTGVHVVTAAASRNRSFYARCGFATLRELDWNGGRIAMLGKRP